MSLGPHAGFIVAAYAVSAIVVAALVIWVIVDYRAQRRALAAFDPGASDRAAQRTGHERHRSGSSTYRRAVAVALPLLAMLGLAALFWFRLGAGDPSQLPSALIGRRYQPPTFRRLPVRPVTVSRCPGSRRRTLPAR